MKRLISILLWCFAGTISAQVYRLAPPQIQCASTVFTDKTSVKMAFDLEGASIHYTLDGSAPTRQSPVTAIPSEFVEMRWSRRGVFIPISTAVPWRQCICIKKAIPLRPWFN
ncbi:MAG: chitobiase/beta-hexosaminidase C-terminal domain-containing protein [Lewinellaceae bacterium]|nr:chitobiase/beta-hexosaminidase C-terminal domain-containing protein [Lewinellaceae bacterium]